MLQKELKHRKVNLEHIPKRKKSFPLKIVSITQDLYSANI